MHLWVADWRLINMCHFFLLKGYFCHTFFVVLSTAWLVISDFLSKLLFYGSMFNVICHISCNNAANFFMGAMIKNLSDYGEIYGIFGRWFIDKMCNKEGIMVLFEKNRQNLSKMDEMNQKRMTLTGARTHDLQVATWVRHSDH